MATFLKTKAATRVSSRESATEGCAVDAIDAAQLATSHTMDVDEVARDIAADDAAIDAAIDASLEGVVGDIDGGDEVAEDGEGGDEDGDDEGEGESAHKKARTVGSSSGEGAIADNQPLSGGVGSSCGGGSNAVAIAKPASLSAKGLVDFKPWDLDAFEKVSFAYILKCSLALVFDRFNSVCIVCVTVLRSFTLLITIYA